MGICSPKHRTLSLGLLAGLTTHCKLAPS